MDVFKKAFNYSVADEYRARGLYPYFRAIETGTDTEVYIKKKKMLMLGSNSYMGLTFDKRTIQAAIDGVKKHGTGCAGSRFLNGTLDLHEDLESKLASFMNRESTLLFSTGLFTRFRPRLSTSSANCGPVKPPGNMTSLKMSSTASLVWRILRASAPSEATQT